WLLKYGSSISSKELRYFAQRDWRNSSITRQLIETSAERQRGSARTANSLFNRMAFSRCGAKTVASAKRHRQYLEPKRWRKITRQAINCNRTLDGSGKRQSGPRAGRRWGREPIVCPTASSLHRRHR